MNKSKLEEFMVFKCKDGKMGVIIRSNYNDNPWWFCYQDCDGGQIFKESISDEHYNNILKLYKVDDLKVNDLRGEKDKLFYALDFMRNRSLSKYRCVYDATQEKFKPVNITINLAVNSLADTEKVFNVISKELQKIGGCQLNIQS